VPLNPPITDWRGQRVWLVGASSGIGRAVASLLHARGAQVCGSARQQALLVGTGEAWLGSQALELGLVDELATSDDVIRAACARGRVLRVRYQRKLTLPERVRVQAQAAWDGIWQPPGPLGGGVASRPMAR